MSDIEKKFRYEVIKLLEPICGSPLENIVGDGGDPDVYCTAGFVELKVAERPKNRTTKINIVVRPAQRLWLKKWRMSGGRAWTLTLLEKTWLLHEGHWASECLGRVDEETLRSNAMAVWERKPTSSELIAALTQRLPRIH